MKKDGIAGTTGWTHYEVVLTVPADADRIEVGLLLYGPGIAWLDDVVLDEIGSRP